jgi:cysteine-rich repeat protein
VTTSSCGWCDSQCRIESGWTCIVAEGAHLSACDPIAVCGDKHPAGDEACDDGNEDPGDGCDGCVVESGWTCLPTLTTCVERDDDGDGLTNNHEAELGTNPTLADTDADGIEDGDEGQLGTDPTNADRDGDSVLDGVERTNGTDPTRADSDGDTVDDATDNCPLVANARQEDRDGDRLGSACDADESAGARLGGGSGCGAGAAGSLGLVAGLVGWLVRARAARRRVARG